MTSIAARADSSSSIPWGVTAVSWFSSSLSDMLTLAMLYAAAFATTHCRAFSM